MTIHTSTRARTWVPNTDGIARSLSAHHVQKYFLMSGGLYLHQEGKHLQVGRQYAWCDTLERARKCRATFDAAAGCKAIEADTP